MAHHAKRMVNGLVPPKGSELEPIFVAMPASRAKKGL